MAGSILPITKVVQISVSLTPSGLNAYNTSNLALFSTDTPSPAFADGYKFYFDAPSVAEDFGSDSITAKMAAGVFSQQPNILLPGGYLVVIPLISSETLAQAINRTVNLVSYFGVMSSQIESEVDMLAAAAVVQAQNMIAAFAQKTADDVEIDGSLDKLTQGKFTQSRGLLYIGDGTGDDSLVFQAAYMGRNLSTQFSGSATVQDPDLKQLNGVLPDPGMNTTIWQKAQDAGADMYVSFGGYSCISSSGANTFFDQIYNLRWFAGALQIAGFNYLAGTSTKIPQTQLGVDGLVAAYGAICAQAVTNGYLAPGKWQSSQSFGDQVLFLANIQQLGYYLFAQPINEQSQVDRAARKAPLVQIAAKESGSIQTSSIVVIVNA